MNQSDWSDAGEYLVGLMRARAWSAPELSRLTNGEVSASAVRSYQAGNRPRAKKAKALALAMGPQAGADLLRVFGYEDILSGLTWPVGRTVTIGRVGRDPATGLTVVPVGLATEHDTAMPINAMIRGSATVTIVDSAGVTDEVQVRVLHKLELQYEGEPLTDGQKEAVAAFIGWLQASTEKESTVGKNDRHVVPNPDGGWDVKKPNAERSSAHTRTQKEAEIRAKEIVGNAGGGEVRIHGRDGKFRDSDTVAPGNDPFPPRDKH